MGKPIHIEKRQTDISKKRYPMLKRGEAGPGATNPLRRRCTTVATFLIAVNLGELKELDTKQATSVLDSVCISFLFISPTIRTLALVSGSTSHIRDITRRQFYSTRRYIQSVGIRRDVGAKGTALGPSFVWIRGRGGGRGGCAECHRPGSGEMG